MQCPRCGGWHYGCGEPPAVNFAPSDPIAPDEARSILNDACKPAGTTNASSVEDDPYSLDSRPEGGRVWNARVYGVDERDVEVTVAFGREGSSREGHSMIAEGFVTDDSFYKEDGTGIKKHDHAGPDGHTTRGRYAGWETFHGPTSGEE